MRSAVFLAFSLVLLSSCKTQAVESNVNVTETVKPVKLKPGTESFTIDCYLTQEACDQTAELQPVIVHVSGTPLDKELGPTFSRTYTNLLAVDDKAIIYGNTNNIDHQKVFQFASLYLLKGQIYLVARGNAALKIGAINKKSEPQLLRGVSFSSSINEVRFNLFEKWAQGKTDKNIDLLYIIYDPDADYETLPVEDIRKANQERADKRK